MSRFGWAYVNSLITGAVANGPTNSIQFNSGSQVLSGSSNFTFNPATNEVTLLGELTGSTLVISASVVSASTYLGITGGSTSPGDGDKAIQFNSGSTFSGSTNLTFDYTTNTLYLTGTLRADNLIVSSSQILKSGSTIFGDDITDTHQFTGSILAGIVSGTTAQFTTISSSYVSASEIANVNFIDFYTSSVANPSYNPSRLFHDINTGDLSCYLPQVTNQQVQLGQQTVVKVKNSSGSPIAKGKLVHITGGVGNNPLINTASWENDNNSANTLGMLMSTVAHNDFGYVLLNGVITDVNTDPATFTAGQVIYLSSSGDYTATTPVAPKHTVRLGEVIRAHATVGSIFIKIDNGYEIDELHNVLITSASTGDLLSYNSSSALWTNSKSLSGSYVITGSLTATTTISGSTGTFTNVTASNISASNQLRVASTSFLNSDVNIGGNILGSAGFKANYATFSTNFTASSLSYFVGVSTTGSVVTASLNSATNYPAGQTLIFKDVGGNAGTNNIRIKPSGSQTIDGATSLIISNTSGSATIVSNGVDGFYIVGLT